MQPTNTQIGPGQTLCMAARCDYGKSAIRSNQKEKFLLFFGKLLRPPPPFGFILPCRSPNHPSAAA
jgi:hypothetical protein